MSFLISQFRPLPTAKADLTDRTVIVTGFLIHEFRLNFQVQMLDWVWKQLVIWRE
jgi:hypothetical protein